MIEPIIYLDTDDIVHCVRCFHFMTPDGWEYFQKCVNEMNEEEVMYLRNAIFKGIDKNLGKYLTSLNIPLITNNGYTLSYELGKFRITCDRKEVFIC